MQAGKLRHRVIIQYSVETQNPNTGAVDSTWSDLATVWAAIEPVSVKDFIAGQSEQSEVTARITMRYRDDITPKMRIYHAAKNVYYDIEGILADKESGMDYLTLPCSEGVKK